MADWFISATTEIKKRKRQSVNNELERADKKDTREVASKGDSILEKKSRRNETDQEDSSSVTSRLILDQLTNSTSDIEVILHQ